MNQKGSVAIIIFAIISILLILFIGKGYFYFTTPIYGQVVDSVTKKPLENISVSRNIQVHLCIFCKTSKVRNIGYSTKTNQNGEFYFTERIISKGFLYAFVDDSLSVSSDLGNINYFPRKNEYGDLELRILLRDSFSRGASFVSDGGFNKYLINLVPKVNNITNCQTELQCIVHNMTNLAIKETNENICLAGDLSSYKSNRNACLGVIASIKKDKSICDKFIGFSPDVYKLYTEISRSMMEAKEAGQSDMEFANSLRLGKTDLEIANLENDFELGFGLQSCYNAAGASQ